MRILKICLGIIIVILGIVVYNSYQNDEISLEKESFMDTVFVEEKPIELVFEDYNLENKVTSFTSLSNYTQIGGELGPYKIYKKDDTIIGVDEDSKLIYFEVETTNLKEEYSTVESFTNVLGKSGVKFTFVDDRGERSMYFYEKADADKAENTFVLLADELNVKEMYLGNNYISLVTETNGIVNSIITKDSTSSVKKAVITNDTEKPEDYFELRANVEEDTFVRTITNKHGYTQNSPYIFENYELQPYFKIIEEEVENAEKTENKENTEKTEENSVTETKMAYPIFEYDSSNYNQYITEDGVFIDGQPETTVVDIQNLTVSTVATTENSDDTTTTEVTPINTIAKRVNSNYTSLTGYVGENYNDGFTYEYYKINDDYYAVRNVEYNNYCFINADGVEVTGFKFYNKPKAFGEYIFVQDSKEGYFLNNKLEKVTYLPSLKGYYDIISYEDAFVSTSLLDDGKIFVTNSEGKLLYESNIEFVYSTFEYDNANQAIEESEVVYTIKPQVYNASFNYNGVYNQITGLENIVAEEEINHTIKKYTLEAVDNYYKNTDKEFINLNNFNVTQESYIENEILSITQVETVKNNGEIVSSTENYYFFDMGTGKELFIKDIFNSDFEARLLEEINVIANNENTNLDVNIDKIGKFNYGDQLYVRYEKGEVVGTYNGEAIDDAYIIWLPLENVSDIIDYKSSTFIAFNKNCKAFSSFVPNQTRSIQYVSNQELEPGVRGVVINRFYPQFKSTGDDVYKTINEYYQAQYDKFVKGNEELDYALTAIRSIYNNKYFGETLLQVSIIRPIMGEADYFANINDLWNLETGEKLDLYNLFDLEPEATEELLDQIIYDQAKTFVESEVVDESVDEVLEDFNILREINTKYTNEQGERVTEVGKRAIDEIDFNNDWYITNDGLVLVYQSFQNGYSGGNYMVFIPYEELNESLNADFIELIEQVNKK